MSDRAALAGHANGAGKELLEMIGRPNGRNGAKKLRQRLEQAGDVHHHLIDDVDEGRGAAAVGKHADEETDGAKRQSAEDTNCRGSEKLANT